MLISDILLNPKVKFLNSLKLPFSNSFIFDILFSPKSNISNFSFAISGIIIFKSIKLFSLPIKKRLS